MVSDLQGVIIAAGRGERLRKGAADIPKPLVRLGGETLIARQAQALTRAGAEGVLAVVNSETAAAIDREGIAMPPAMRIVVRDTANSMETLLVAGESLRPGNFLCATVDAIVPDAEFVKFVSQARAMAAEGFDGVLGVVEWRGDKNPLFAKVTEHRQITALGEDQTPLVTAGVYLLPTKIFDFAKEARAARIPALRRFLAMLIDKRIRLGAIEMAGVIDIDEADDLAAARAATEVRR